VLAAISLEATTSSSNFPSSFTTLSAASLKKKENRLMVHYFIVYGT
jgi:hypothetical protein